MTPKRKRRQLVLRMLALVPGTICLLLYTVLLVYILARGLRGITFSFFLGGSSVLFDRQGILPPLVNTLLAMVLCVGISVPVGIGASFFVNLYLPAGKVRRLTQYLLDMLLGMPTVVTGLLGLLFFSRVLGWRLNLLAACLTMCITLIPFMMYLARRALEAVPREKLEQAMALGATRWHILWRFLLPEVAGELICGAVLVATRVLAEGGVFLMVAGSGSVIAGSAGQTYMQSSGTMASMLYVYAAHRGDLEMAFSIGAVLILLGITLQLVNRAVRRRFAKKNRMR